MYTDVPDQVLRLSMEGAEFALKISGAAAKNIAAALVRRAERPAAHQGQGPDHHHAAAAAPHDYLYHQERGLLRICQAS